MGKTSHLINKEIENTMLVSFDIKFIRQDQKQCRNGEACRASPTCFWSSLINLTAKDTYVVFCLSRLLADLMAKRQQTQCKAEAVLFQLANIKNAL